jgi:hypothetical protein
MSETKQSRPSKKQVRRIVELALKSRTPSGYSLVVPPDGVMYVSDGVEQEHDRWYVQVNPEPEYIADTRRQEFLSILSEAQDAIHKRFRWTVYLTSMLPVV